MPEIRSDTLLRGWVQETGRGIVFPTPDFWSREEVPFLEAHRRERMNFHVNPLTQKTFTQEEIEHRIKTERKVHNQQFPTFILRVTEENALVVQPEKGRSREVVELARYIGKREEKHAVVLMNGDGFEDRTLQTVQATLRNLLSMEFREQKGRLIVPYQALSSARLNLNTIRPIHITADRRVGVVVKVPMVPKSVLREHIPSKENREIAFVHNNRQYWATYQYTYAPKERPPMYWIMHHAEFAPNPVKHQITERKNEGTGADIWTVTESVHRLGSAVFSAEGPDGVRHRWLSSFDQNEDPAMYFLAQLPDKGGIRYITHAVKLLAPKIVLKAREDGRRVFRQGDIFAIETDLTDEDFASHVVARRGNVFRGTTEIPNPNQRAGGPGELEVPRLTEEARNDLKLRRSIMIYGTGHTAEYVVQTDHGTYVKGMMYHDPILENIRSNRPPEHRVLVLRDAEWYLCVRNTVPRINNTTDTGGPENALRTQQLPDLQHQESRRDRNVPEPVLS